VLAAAASVAVAQASINENVRESTAMLPKSNLLLTCLVAIYFNTTFFFVVSSGGAKRKTKPLKTILLENDT
jgi:hypothetical protein